MRNPVGELDLFYGDVVGAGNDYFTIALTGMFGSDFTDGTSSRVVLRKETNMDIQEGDFVRVHVSVFRGEHRDDSQGDTDAVKPVAKDKAATKSIPKPNNPLFS